jgi:hypothetical protein
LRIPAESEALERTAKPPPPVQIRAAPETGASRFDEFIEAVFSQHLIQAAKG